MSTDLCKTRVWWRTDKGAIHSGIVRAVGISGDGEFRLLVEMEGGALTAVWATQADTREIKP